MSIFDVGSIKSSGLQSASSTVASSLVPKRHAAKADALSVVDTPKLRANATTAGKAAAAATATDGSQITSNDFLVLLVSELKNQDPTQPSDPNAYISQLVGVNSLQQLISINQGITSIGTGSGTGTPATTPS